MAFANEFEFEFPCLNSDYRYITSDGSLEYEVTSVIAKATSDHDLIVAFTLQYDGEIFGALQYREWESCTVKWSKIDATLNEGFNAISINEDAEVLAAIGTGFDGIKFHFIEGYKGEEAKFLELIFEIVSDILPDGLFSIDEHTYIIASRYYLTKLLLSDTGEDYFYQVQTFELINQVDAAYHDLILGGVWIAQAVDYGTEYHIQVLFYNEQIQYQTGFIQENDGSLQISDIPDVQMDATTDGSFVSVMTCASFIDDDDKSQISVSQMKLHANSFQENSSSTLWISSMDDSELVCLSVVSTSLTTATMHVKKSYYTVQVYEIDFATDSASYYENQQHMQGHYLSSVYHRLESWTSYPKVISDSYFSGATDNILGIYSDIRYEFGFVVNTLNEQRLTEFFSTTQQTASPDQQALQYFATADDIFSTLESESRSLEESESFFSDESIEFKISGEELCGSEEDEYFFGLERFSEFGYDEYFQPDISFIQPTALETVCFPKVLQGIYASNARYLLEDVGNEAIQEKFVFDQVSMTLTLMYPSDTYSNSLLRNNRTGNYYMNEITLKSDNGKTLVKGAFIDVQVNGPPVITLPNSATIYIQVEKPMFYDVALLDPDYDCLLDQCEVEIYGSNALNFLQINKQNGTLSMSRLCRERDIGEYVVQIKVRDQLNGWVYSSFTVSVTLEAKDNTVVKNVISDAVLDHAQETEDWQEEQDEEEREQEGEEPIDGQQLEGDGDENWNQEGYDQEGDEERDEEDYDEEREWDDEYDEDEDDEYYGYTDGQSNTGGRSRGQDEQDSHEQNEEETTEFNYSINTSDFEGVQIEEEEEPEYPDDVVISKIVVNHKGLLTLTLNRDIMYPETSLLNCQYDSKSLAIYDPIPIDDLMKARLDKRNLQTDQVVAETEETCLLQEDELIQLSIISDQEAENTGFTWSVTQVYQDEIAIQILFDKPLQISQGSTDKIEVTVDYMSFEYQKTPTIKEKRLPTQMQQGAAAEATEALANTMESFTTATTVTSCAIGILQAGAMSQIWGMINGLQIIVHAPMLKSIFPANASMVVDTLISFATFDFLPTDLYLGWALEFPDDYEGISESFINTGYDSFYTIELLGSVFLFMIIFIFVLAILFILKIQSLLCKINLLMRLKQKIAGWILWNPIIRLVLEGCLELGISLQINMTHLDYSTFTLKVNSIVTIILIIICASFPLFMIAFYCLKVNKFHDHAFEAKFGSTYEGLYMEKRPKLMLVQPIFFVMRRYLFGATCIFFPDLLFLQIMYQFLCSIFQIIFLILYKPWDDLRQNKLDIYNEVTTMFVLYNCLLFTQNQSSEDRLLYGWPFILFVSQNLLTHISLLLYAQLLSIKKSVLKKCNKKKKLKQEYQAAKKPVGIKKLPRRQPIVRNIDWDPLGTKKAEREAAIIMKGFTYSSKNKNLNLDEISELDEASENSGRAKNPPMIEIQRDADGFQIPPMLDRNVKAPQQQQMGPQHDTIQIPQKTIKLGKNKHSSQMNLLEAPKEMSFQLNQSSDYQAPIKKSYSNHKANDTTWQLGMSDQSMILPDMSMDMKSSKHLVDNSAIFMDLADSAPQHLQMPSQYDLSNNDKQSSSYQEQQDDELVFDQSKYKDKTDFIQQTMFNLE